MKKGIAVAGNLAVDHVKFIDTYPEKGMLCNIGATSRGIGGCAANTSWGLAALDRSLPLTVLGAVGDDENGAFLLEKLRGAGINVAGIRRLPEYGTSYTDVMTVRETGERTFFHARGANAAFGIDKIDFESLDASIFHIGYALLLDSFDADDPEYGTVMARALARAREAGMKTCMDVVSEAGTRFARVVKPSLRWCDYAVMNEIESGQVTGIEARGADGRIDGARVKEILAELMACGVRELAVVHAPEGGYAMDRSGVFTVSPGFRLPDGYIKGTVGAGDAFCAGILYGLWRGFDTAYALRLANACAVCNLSCANASDGMRSLDETLRAVEELALQQ